MRSKCESVATATANASAVKAAIGTVVHLAINDQPPQASATATNTAAGIRLRDAAKRTIAQPTINSAIARTTPEASTRRSDNTRPR
jgi:hypothetical protein